MRPALVWGWVSSPLISRSARMLRTVALDTPRPYRSTSAWEPTGTALETYSSMTARRIDSDRRSREPLIRGRRATLGASRVRPDGPTADPGELALNGAE